MRRILLEKRHNYEFGITGQNLIMFLKTGETYSVYSEWFSIWKDSLD